MSRSLKVPVSWETPFQLLVAVKKETGSVNVPVELVVDGYRIGWWCRFQRRHYSRGKLSPEQIFRLESIGFIWDTHEAEWEAHFTLLKRVARDSGSPNIRTDTVVDGVRIGSWVNTQRTLKKQGRLDPDRQSKLEAIGFAWCIHEANWDDHYAVLKRIAEKTGTARVAFGHVVDGRPIGTWVNTQRIVRKKGRLSTERIKQLNAIGFEWTIHQSRRSWNQNFEHLCQIARKRGDSNIPSNLVDKGYRIGGWVSAQRKRYWTGRLPKDEIDRLESIGFSWGGPRSSWDVHFLQLAKIAREDGDANIRFDLVVDGFNLGDWACQQRYHYHQGLLAATRIKRLESIGFKWNILADAWETNLAILTRFAKSNGIDRVHRHLVINGYKIGFWVNNQRVRYRQGNLSPERIARLEAIGFQWSVKDSPRRSGGRARQPVQAPRNRRVGRHPRGQRPEQHTRHG